MSSKPQEFGSVETARLPARPLHLAIGIFDGVHLGHRAVVEAAVQSARRSGGLAAVLTFDPHPSVLFQPNRVARLILPGHAKTRLLFGLGVDAVIVQPFTHEFARLPADQFIPWLQRYLPGLAALYVGQNWRFGAGRTGDVAALVKAAGPLGLSVFSAPPVNYDGHVISSTRIRDLLEKGDVAGASALLGYTYFAEGTVIPGRRLGRTLGFPTLNLSWSPGLRPRFGVYAVRVGPGGGDAASDRPWLPGVANYGLRPTVEKTATEPLLETHILGNSPYNEGDPITVEWTHFLRPEMKFAGLDELKAQIAKDVDAARAQGT
jgi:riboflavin kinase/FMN adenylyltransferase